MAKMYRVRAERTFNAHTAGDELLVSPTAEVEAEIKAGLWDLLAVEGDEPKPKAPPKSKAKSAKKTPKPDPVDPKTGERTKADPDV